MAAITGTYGLVKRAHIALRVTLTDVLDEVSNTDIRVTSGFQALTGITSALSPLYGFLNTTLADDTAAQNAFRDSGGQVTIRQISGTATDVIGCRWTAQNSKPALSFYNGVDQVLEVVVSMPHSIIQ